MATLRELKGRIGSVASSEKITGAMKMISSAKMHKAEAALKKQLPYRTQIETIIGNLLGAGANFSSPLIEEREVRTVALLVWGSDDGLCGAYNVNIFKLLAGRLDSYRKKYGSEVRISIVPVGSKIEKAVRKLNQQNVSVDPIKGVDSKANGENVKFFLNEIVSLFKTGNVDVVDMLYMNFLSISRQRPRFEQLLPILSSQFDSIETNQHSDRPYIFEPDVETIFREILPLYLLATVQEVFTENQAAEQAARVMAMQSANDNAKKLLEQLRLEYNKLRQQSITTELLDIIGGQVR